jgi:hypothetical protein
MFSQFRIGTKVKLIDNLALLVDARGMFVGESTFNFGSTIYSDHAPTDNWIYKMGGSSLYSVNVGLCVNM